MAGFPNYTYPAYGGYNPVTPFAPAPQIYQPMQQPSPQPVQAAQTVGNTNTQPNFFCRPVASREEALGVPVDFMGAPMFFPDLAHNVAYMKRFNTNSGAADVFEFKLDVPREKQQQAPAQVAAFAPLDEFIDMKDTVQNLKDEVDRLKKPAGKAVKKNDASDAVSYTHLTLPDGTERRKSHANAPANGWAEPTGRPGYAAHPGEKPAAAPPNCGEHGKAERDLS